MRAMVSADIRKNIEALTHDPIIHEMAEVVREEYPDAEKRDGDWIFIRGAYNEYKSRGGTLQPITIGGPAAAINLILEREGESDD